MKPNNFPKIETPIVEGGTPEYTEGPEAVIARMEAANEAGRKRHGEWAERNGVGNVGMPSVGEYVGRHRRDISGEPTPIYDSVQHSINSRNESTPLFDEVSRGLNKTEQPSSRKIKVEYRLAESDIPVAGEAPALVTGKPTVEFSTPSKGREVNPDVSGIDDATTDSIEAALARARGAAAKEDQTLGAVKDFREHLAAKRDSSLARRAVRVGGAALSRAQQLVGDAGRLPYVKYQTLGAGEKPVEDEGTRDEWLTESMRDFRKHVEENRGEDITEKAKKLRERLTRDTHRPEHRRKREGVVKGAKRIGAAALKRVGVGRKEPLVDIEVGPDNDQTMAAMRDFRKGLRDQK